MDNNNLDGRLNSAPNHWKNNFKIYYMEEKMRSQADPNFSSLCDRVCRGTITENDEKFLRSRIQFSQTESDNEILK